MPNLFFSGTTEFVVSGSSDQTKALRKAIKNDEYGIVFTYENDGIPCIFYMHPFHIVKGSLRVDPAGDSFKVIFNGVARIPLDKSAADFLTKNVSTLSISGVTCHPFSICIDKKRGSTIPSSLKISKSAPK